MFSLKSQGRAEAQGRLTFLFPSLSSYVFLTLFHFLNSFPSCFSSLYSTSFLSLLIPSLTFLFSLLHFLPILSLSTHLYLSRPHLLVLPVQPLSPASLRFSLQAGRGGRKGSSAQGALVGVLFSTSFQIGAGGLAAVSQSPTS